MVNIVARSIETRCVDDRITKSLLISERRDRKEDAITLRFPGGIIMPTTRDTILKIKPWMVAQYGHTDCAALEGHVHQLLIDGFEKISRIALNVIPPDEIIKMLRDYPELSIKGLAVDKGKFAEDMFRRHTSYRMRQLGHGFVFHSEFQDTASFNVKRSEGKKILIVSDYFEKRQEELINIAGVDPEMDRVYVQQTFNVNQGTIGEKVATTPVKKGGLGIEDVRYVLRTDPEVIVNGFDLSSLGSYVSAK